MIVADSSYIAEGVLVDQGLLAGPTIMVPDLAIYETVGAIWKHEVALGRIKEGKSYVDALLELVRTHKLLGEGPDEELLLRSYDLAVR